MAAENNVAERILAAQKRHCKQLAAALDEARNEGASPAELADLEAQELAARNRYQEIAVDISGGGRNRGAGNANGRRPWWRFW